MFSPISPLVSGKTVATAAVDKATVLNTRFAAQCSQPPLARSQLWGVSMSSAYPKFTFSPVTVDQVHAQLSRLNISKSTGHDDLPACLLRACAEQLSPSLCRLFNMSLSSSEFPTIWKLAVVQPVLKDGKPATAPESYRPISLLCIVSKVFEALCHDQLLTHCMEQGVIPDEQYGFLKGRSAEWLLLSITQQWSYALDRRQSSHAVLLDMAKAFDRVDHYVLLCKLEMIGLSQSALVWFKSYLSGRQISTKVDNVCSAVQPISSGVPQGSVFGPLLFLLFNADLPSTVKCNTAMFADDTMITDTCCEPSRQPCCTVCAAICECQLWASTNNASFNATKSAELFITSVRRRAEPVSHLTLDNVIIPRVASHKHLGVVIEGNLTWSSHVNMVISKVQPKIHLLMALAFRTPLSAFALTRFYLMLIRPHLEYCSSVWTNCGKVAAYKLERVQLRAARYILRHRRHESTYSDRLRLLNLPTLAWRRRIHQLSMFWRLVNGHGPPELADRLPKMCKDRCSYDLSRPLNFQLSLSHSGALSRSFIVSACIVWNGLPLAVQKCSSLPLFVKMVSQFFDVDRFVFGLP